MVCGAWVGASRAVLGYTLEWCGPWSEKVLCGISCQWTRALKGCVKEKKKALWAKWGLPNVIWNSHESHRLGESYPTVRSVV